MEAKEKVHLNYFQMLFRKEFNKLGESFIEVNLDFYQLEKLTRYTDIYASFPYNKKRIELYNMALACMGEIYCKLTNTEIKHPETWNPFVYIEQILGTITNAIYPREIPKNKKVSYQESFLWSLKSIWKDYFWFLEKGDITLSSSEEEEKENKYLEITLNNHNKMIECEAINMDMKESAETLLRVLKLEKENQQGPIQNVTYKYTKKIY